METVTLRARAAILAGALPHIRAFHGKTFVIGFTGRALADPTLLGALARDCALLRLVGVRTVIVHGGGGAAMPDADPWSLLAARNREIAALIAHHGGRPVGLSGEDGQLFGFESGTAPAEGAGPHAGLRGDPEIITTITERQFIPVIMPVATGVDDRPVPIEPGLCAGLLAKLLKAEKLVLMGDGAGLQRPDGRLIKALTLAEARDPVISDVLAPADRATLEAVLDAVQGGVGCAHLIDAGVSGALLLEMFTSEGLGTTVRRVAGADLMADSRRYLGAS
jgi:acetylglutamate kinase